MESKTLHIKFFWLLFLFLAVFCTSCTRLYVNVNGYLEQNTHIEQGKRVFVFINKGIANPILAKEIADKMQKVLVTKGYYLADDISNSDYVLTFAFAIDSGKPITSSSTYSYSTSSYELNIYTGQFELVPHAHTQTNISSGTMYTRNLVLTLFDSKELLVKQKANPIWIGEIGSSGSSSDLRKVLDYLIVAGFENFGEDTKGQQKYKFLEGDKRIQNLY